MKKYLLLLLSAGLFFTSCKNDDDIFPDDNGDETQKTANDYPVQNFMYQVMNSFYFWQEDVPNLADSKFKSLDDPDYISFLASESDPEAFFNSLLFEDDRFSFLREDYHDLVNSFQGISKSNGLEFGLSLFGDNRDVFGYVQYVVKDSDADKKGMKRGDIFLTVDGEQLFYNSATDNNFHLFNEDSYTLGMADIIDKTITPNNKKVTLTKEEGLTENPIYLSTVIEHNGVKVGYIMYNSFIASYDDELNEVFGNLKAENIDELVLDFRYNPGGRVTSAIQIASAVYGTNTDELFLKARYNEKIMETFDPGDGEENFVDTTFDSKTPLNTLNLKRVFVIATGATASASELVMNGLAPYVDVVHIGENTVGKNEFSNTFVDDPENNYFYNEDYEDRINPDNQWGIQPLLGRNENADGFLDYTSGLVPDYELDEDAGNLGVLGDADEPLLALALSVISGETAKRSFEPLISVDFVSSSKMFKPGANKMLMDGLIKPLKSK
ncbi:MULTISPECIES: S41 family peptidase [Zobellia]|uniref:Carboxy-terminal processing peptidase, family S41 n=1 Tax=Zobellia galactanivorans (strain DSM 12802 / CCUG 47099 / CIP 106680 / NCIMB 13871 / Dsij) TaxID=63186 RepID=G0L8S5_ZOBGA|nr:MULTISPECIES: S41 family peptidase [Zobellia]MBU3027151.1 carboxyl-terminal protease [Zobellia galactanivorans]OWW24820.1 carboxyl-terminal protease [Zobellia sp. OII3]CAZ94126.1 Carboxy-terminal processing peptidase, family S41 [Zobellia galactanivorans]